MPTGRPTDYEPEYCDKLIAHMELGYSFESFAGKIKVCKQTIYTWLEKYPEFLDAKKRGTELSRYFWEKFGINGMAGHVKNFNCAAWIFNMKNRFREDWHDRQEIEHAFPKPTVIERIDGSEVLVGISEKIEEP